MNTEKKVYRSASHMNEEDFAGANISWRAILAGLVTFLALNLLSLLIGSAIGLGVPNLTSPDPFAGVGTGLVWWVILTTIISMAAGGFVTGLMANRLGFAHGFLAWATSIIVGFFMLASLTGSLLGLAGNALGTAGQVAGDVVGGAVGGAADAVGTVTQETFDAISENVNVDTEELNQVVSDVLENTEIEVLQPEFLSKQVDDTVSEIGDAAYNVVVQGNDLETEVNKVTSNIEDRLAVINENVNYEDLRAEIAANTQLSEAEVDAAVDNIETAWNNASEQANQALNEASQALDKLTTNVAQGAQDVAQDVVETTDEVTNEASKYSLYLFFGLLAAMFVTGFAGEGGVKVAHNLVD